MDKDLEELLKKGLEAKRAEREKKVFPAGKDFNQR